MFEFAIFGWAKTKANTLLLKLKTKCFVQKHIMFELDVRLTNWSTYALATGMLYWIEYHLVSLLRLMWLLLYGLFSLPISLSLSLSSAVFRESNSSWNAHFMQIGHKFVSLVMESHDKSDVNSTDVNVYSAPINAFIYVKYRHSSCWCWCWSPM